MKKKRLRLRGAILIVAAWISGMVGYSLNQAGAAPILYWTFIAGLCVLLCFGLSAFLQAYQQKEAERKEHPTR